MTLFQDRFVREIGLGGHDPPSRWQRCGRERVSHNSRDLQRFLCRRLRDGLLQKASGSENGRVGIRVDVGRLPRELRWQFRACPGLPR